MSSYVERAPVPALVGRVRTVWVQRTGAQPYVQRNLATGGVELHCPLGGTPRLVGPLTGPDVVVLPPHTTVVGARFWPGALAVPAPALLDRTVPLADLWGSVADRLADAPTPGAALDLLQRHLVRTAPPDPLVAAAVRMLMPWRPDGVAALPAALALSASQLRRRFLAAVGLGPKAVQRTLRFQGYLALAQAAADRPTVTDLAAAVGYADHAHLGRECLRLTGLTPRALLHGALDRCGCGHDHSASYRPFLARFGQARRSGGPLASAG